MFFFFFCNLGASPTTCFQIIMYRIRWGIYNPKLFLWEWVLLTTVGLQCKDVYDCVVRLPSLCDVLMMAHVQSQHLWWKESDSSDTNCLLPVTLESHCQSKHTVEILTDQWITHYKRLRSCYIQIDLWPCRLQRTVGNLLKLRAISLCILTTLQTVAELP